MDFIFMLTRDDRTVADGLSLLDSVADLELRHIGFKDIGADRDTLGALNERVRAMGAKSYLEVVGAGAGDCLAAARTAVEIGVDRLLGGGPVEATLEILDGAGIEYFPFPGFPMGHPTELGGTAVDVAAHCVDFMAKGCAGADLLAYRASDADPMALVRAARGSLNGGTLIVAGSISTVQQIADLSAAGVDAFTIGSAILDGAFSPGKETIRARIEDVLAACAAPPA
jgi:hypothetical protein